MLALRIHRTPRWLDMPRGVRVQVRPLTTAVSEAAFADSLARIAPLKQAAEDAAAAGTPLDPDEPNGANAAWLQGLQWQLLCEAFARYGIVAWEGVGGEDGLPLPVTPATCAAFAEHPEFGRVFFQRYQATLEEVELEGNASAPLPDGGTAKAPSTAAAVQTARPGRAKATASDQAVPAAPPS